MPAFPTVEVDLVDKRNMKDHRYHLPKRRGENAPYIGSVPLTFDVIDKHYCYAPREHNKLEEYISAVEDVAMRRCR